MSDMQVADDVGAGTQDLEVERTQGDDAETDIVDSGDDDISEDKPELSVEEKLALLEKDNQGKQGKINRQRAVLSNLQEQNTAIMKELNELRQKAQAVQETSAPKKPSIQDFDTLAEFDNAMEKYVQDVQKHSVEQAKAKALEESANAQKREIEQKIYEERSKQRAEQEREYVAINPSYKSSVLEVDAFIQTANLNNDVMDAILDQVYEGNVPMLIDYFGKNNGENIQKLEDITRMPAPRAAVEIYKIQQSLKAPEKREVKPPPAPIKTKSAGGNSKALKENASGDDVLKYFGFK